MEGLMIAIGILYIIVLLWNILTDDNSDRIVSAFMLSGLMVVLFALVWSYESKDEPTAIDVYECKTTLQITYEDSIPVDTVVVYKPEFRK